MGRKRRRRSVWNIYNLCPELSSQLLREGRGKTHTHTLGERGGDIINKGQQRRGTDGREGEGQYFRF